jgi:hypothetical protein
MEEFFTREKANDGIRFPLTHPDGTATEHWLQIRGVDSDEFHKAERQERRNFLPIRVEADMLHGQKEKEDFILDAQDKMERNLIASLVSGWSFDTPPTPENVVNFLQEAPQIAQAINSVSAERFRFFGKGLSSSGDTQKVRSSLASPQKGAQPRKKRISSKSGSKRAKSPKS